MVAVLGSFLVLESVGAAKEGPRGTLSAYLRHVAGLDPRCRHMYLGRLVMVGFFGWATAHLGWGLAGYIPQRRTSC